MSTAPGDTRHPFEVIYPHAPDRGLATDGAVYGSPDPIADRNFKFRPNHLVLDPKLTKRDLIKDDDNLIPLPHAPANTCFRNSLFACLFNIAPFVNFVQQQAQAASGAEVGQVFRELDAVGKAYRAASGHSKRTALNTTTKALWHTLTKTRGATTGGAPSQTWLEMVSSMHGHGGGLDPADAHRAQDPDELYIYLMERLSRGMIPAHL